MLEVVRSGVLVWIEGLVGQRICSPLSVMNASNRNHRSKEFGLWKPVFGQSLQPTPRAVKMRFHSMRALSLVLYRRTVEVKLPNQVEAEGA